MTEGNELTLREAEALVWTLEEAARVHRRHQFFVWTQGQFQALVPHTVMCCGTYHRQRRALVFDHFSNVMVSARVQAALTTAGGPLLKEAVAQWVESGGRPMLVTPAQLPGEATTQAQELLADLASPHLLLHGVARPHQPSEIESFFVFVTEGVPDARRLMLRLELLLPHIHILWRHVQTIERSLQTASGAVADPPSAPQPRHAVTHRELQILLWMREGKSNLEIGEVLSISPLTVKNHVQKILRKLNAANRAQAVAQAMSLNLLKLDDRSHGAG